MEDRLDETLLISLKLVHLLPGAPAPSTPAFITHASAIETTLHDIGVYGKFSAIELHDVHVLLDGALADKLTVAHVDGKRGLLPAATALAEGHAPYVALERLVLSELSAQVSSVLLRPDGSILWPCWEKSVHA